jgi:hypothetical protein
MWQRSIGRVWHSDSNASVDAIRTCIKRLEDKLDPDEEDSVIQTIPRVGYKLKAETTYPCLYGFIVMPNLGLSCLLQEWRW